MMRALKSFWTQSIRRQLMLGIGLVHAVLMTIFVLDLVSREQSFLIELSQNQAIGLVETLAANGSSWVLANDYIGMEEVIQSQSGFPGLRYALFTDTKGKVLGFSDREKVGLFMSDPQSKKLLLAKVQTQVIINNSLEIDVASPILSADKHIGWARVGISRKDILKNIDIVTRNGIYYTILAIVVGLIFAWVMAKGLTLGVTKLSEGVDRLAKGDRNVDFNINRSDELGHLGAAMAKAMHAMHQNEILIQQQGERTRVTLQSIGDGVITTFSDGTVEYLNPIAENLTGWASSDAKGKELIEVFPITNEITGEMIKNPVDKVLKDNVIVGLANHTALTHRNGSMISIEDSAAPIHDDEGNITGVVLVFHDATEERIFQDKMNHQATHDALTGIWNRTAFEKQLEELQTDSNTSKSTHALLYLDLDQFKVVNDTAGHIAGDELLKQITQEFSTIVRGSDMLARIGGDEFSVLLKNCHKEQCEKIAEALRAVTDDFRFIWGETTYRIGVSIGISMITSTSLSSEVLSQADVACYKAKDNGRNCVQFYSETDKELSTQFGEMHWVSRINEALEKNQFILYRQKISKLNHEAEAINYFEILIRLKEENGNIIAPNSFIPAAERYGLMSKVDWFVVEAACSWLAKQPLGSVKLSINLSGQSLGDKEFLNLIETKILKNSKIAQFIVFEITETAAISNLRVAINFMEKLLHLGIKFSLDDFGSGLSSFAYLKNMPVSYIKIDGSFIRDMATDEVDAAMVQAITQVGLKLGMETVAEFVENKETLDLLNQFGVTYAQGYYLDKPSPLI